MRPEIIALSGPKGAGKSAVAANLSYAHGYWRLKFAAPIKAMLRALLAIQAVDAGTIERMIEGDLKELPALELGGRSPRYAMDTLGTEWGRQLMAQDLWSGAWERAYAAFPRCGRPVVADDCRFPEEAAAVWRLNGRVVRIERAGTGGGTHAAERQDFAPDYTIPNDGGVREAVAAVLASTGHALSSHPGLAGGGDGGDGPATELLRVAALQRDDVGAAGDAGGVVVQRPHPGAPERHPLRPLHDDGPGAPVGRAEQQPTVAFPGRMPLPRRVILESPYAGEVARNEAYARRAMADSLRRGEAPIASHLLYTQPGVLDDGDPQQRALGIAAGLAWGPVAEATVVYHDLGITDGMMQGIARAESEGRDVVHRSIGA